MTELKKELGATHPLIPFIDPLASGRQRRQQKKPRKAVEQHEDFLALVRSEDGSVQIRASPSLKALRVHILQEAYQKMTEWCAGGDLICNDREAAEAQATNGLSYSTDAGTIVVEPVSNFFSEPSQRPAKRHRSDTGRALAVPMPLANMDASATRFIANNCGNMIGIQVGDREAMENWFSDAFRAVQQVGCRLIAKLWIKKIHPKKQSTHPYNGGYPRDQPRDPARTRPPYWPLAVTHKEPDHIDRSQRTRLLVHLIMNTPHELIVTPPVDSGSTKYVTSAELLEALEERKTEFKAEPWKVIKEIIRARKFMEQFENDEIDGTMVLNLMNFPEGSRRTSDDSDEEDAMHEIDPASENPPDDLPKIEEKPSGPSLQTESRPLGPGRGENVNGQSNVGRSVNRPGPQEITFVVNPNVHDMHIDDLSKHNLNMRRSLGYPTEVVITPSYDHHTSPHEISQPFVDLSGGSTVGLHAHDLPFNQWLQHGMPLTHHQYAGHMMLEDPGTGSFAPVSMQNPVFRNAGPEHGSHLPNSGNGMSSFNIYGGGHVRSLPLRPGSNPYMASGDMQSHQMAFYSS